MKTANNTKEISDEIIEDLWKVKDYYAEACESNFSKLTMIVKKDIEHLQLNRVDEKTFEEAI